MIKVGVVGVGSMGINHVRNYYEMDNVELVGISDIDIDRTKDVAIKYETKVFNNYKELIGKVDAVSIAVPTIYHKRVAIDFCKGGVNCLVEKPISFNIKDAKDIINTAEKNNVILMVGHIENFNPAVIKVKEIIDEGLLGQILTISTKRIGPFVKRIVDVGIIVDTVTHDIGVIRYLAGKEPSDIFSKFGGIKNKKGDHALIVLDFDDFFASMEVNWFTPYKMRNLIVTGTDGVVLMDYVTQKIELCDSEWKRVSQIEKEEPLRKELEHFIDCVENDKEPLINGYEGLKILEIAIKAENNENTIT